MGVSVQLFPALEHKAEFEALDSDSLMQGFVAMPLESGPVTAVSVRWGLGTQNTRLVPCRRKPQQRFLKRT